MVFFLRKSFPSPPPLLLVEISTLKSVVPSKPGIFPREFSYFSAPCHPNFQEQFSCAKSDWSSLSHCPGPFASLLGVTPNPLPDQFPILALSQMLSFPSDDRGRHRNTSLIRIWRQCESLFSFSDRAQLHELKQFPYSREARAPPRTLIHRSLSLSTAPNRSRQP